MAGNPNYDTQAPADMDYPEHERTYNLFLSMFKWGTIGVIALLLGMMVGLLGSGGFLGGIGTFILALVIGYFAAR
ncbi:MAG: aa3-type cytochrome c oxidase subunit IV [Fulvimarina manganoxydans]|uniref:aa3-type cytochrome c oxidase subunit IV n=1 Tax=Fulvimarina manganoxydans TaxID=937218 RepID=UPI002353495C|nr:aa3-type cytochrome c oxidase subunit IV [Fulvimarina manganoxydans]MCK5930531.1 aa3-type cytochrome c oxidase subunit IV [Fulvimarina manganoxydans]MEE2951674.1 aa3-type cytochrome c oxidase subunit IV [Pseudomonadota bacterium]